MNMLNKNLLRRIAFNSALGIILIFLWTRFVNLEETLVILKKVQLQYLFFFFVFFIISSALRGLRLKLLLKDQRISLKDVIMLNFLSQFLSFMIPVRAGELTKSVYLTTQFQQPLAKTMVWVFVDRFLDFWVVLLMISTFLLSVPTNLPSQFIRAAFVLSLLFSLAFILAVKSEKISKRIVNFLSKFFIVPNIKRWFISFAHTVIEGFEILRRHPLELLELVSLTLLATIFDGLIWMVIFLSVGVSLDFAKSLLGNALAALSFLIPAAPGYVGSAEAATLAVFGGVLGVETNFVSAASVVFHVLTIFALLLFGICSLYLLKFDLNLVWKRLKGGVKD